MKVPRTVPPTLACLCLAGTARVLAAEPAEPLLDELVQDRHRLSVSARFSFGLSARVTHGATVEPAGADYLDGFVRPDVNGGGDGLTWYWGYQSAEQLVGGGLELHRLSGLPSDGRSARADEGVQGGFEVVYGHELGRFRLGRRTANWGLELGVSALNPRLESQEQYAGLAALQVHRYDLGGVLPPGAPYAGRFDGPGPLLDLEPAATRLESVPSTTDIHTTLDALLVGAKFGPFLEIPLVSRLQLHLHAGVAALATFTEFKFTETAQVPGLPGGSFTRRGEEKEDGFEVGGYAQVALNYEVTDFLSVFAGGQYLFLGDLEVEAGNKAATLEFGSAVEAVIGLRTSF